MAELFNIYCDESCHLEHDAIPVMVLGAVWCRADRVEQISRRIRELKIKHGLLRSDELRSPSATPFEAK